MKLPFIAKFGASETYILVYKKVHPTVYECFVISSKLVYTTTIDVDLLKILRKLT